MNVGTVVEAIGLTREEAIGRALRELKATPEEVTVEVAEEIPAHTIVRATLKERKKSVQETLRVLECIAKTICPKAMVGLASVDEKEVRFNVSVGDLALLIGGHASTLEAIQTLTMEVFKRLQYHRTLVVDIGNYRRRRVLLWKKEVKGWLETLVSTGKDFVSNPLNREDRELIYELLRECPGVEFRTIGDERDRRIIVFLKEGTPNAPTPQ